MPIKPEILQQAKKVSIVEYLASKGILPVSEEADELLYLSPLREDKNPSFYVNPRGNVFKDFVWEEHRGDAIKLVELLEKCRFSVAVKILLDFTGYPLPDFLSIFLPAAEMPKRGITVLRAQDLTKSSLIEYAESRGIPFNLARRYLKYVTYTNRGVKYFGLGFRNNSGGYELRNRIFPTPLSTSPKDITTFDTGGRKMVAVFEGFFDFLSALVCFGLEAPRMPTVVLNSVHNRKKAVDFLSQFEQVNCFLDRDKAGIECFERLVRVDKLNAVDYSGIYEGYKDFNGFLTKTKPVPHE